MKMTKKEFDAQVELAGKLTGEAREAFVANLKSAQVVDTDSEGNEVVTAIQLMDIPAAPVAKAAEPQDAAKQTTIKAAPVRPEPEVKIEVVTQKSKRFSEGLKAHRFGMFWKAQFGDAKAAEYCRDHGIVAKHNSFQDTVGGVLVPDEFRADIITLLSEYGAARRLAEVVPMSRDTLQTPKLTSNLTAFRVGQGQSGTNSNNAFNLVTLNAKKIMAATTFTKELVSDAAVNLGDYIAERLAYAIASREDLDVIAGTGSSTNGGITGYTTRLTNINGVDDGGGLVLAAGNQWSEITLANFHSVIGRVPSYAFQFGGPSWCMSRSFYYQVAHRLAYAAGGVFAAEIVNGVASERFLGYPVIFTDAMPQAEANSQVAALFGNFRAAAVFGDRQTVETETAMSGTTTLADGTSVDLFLTDQYGIKSVVRNDFVFHDAGTSTQAGAVVGLITQAS